MENTILIDSHIGQRLKKYSRSEQLFLMWKGKRISLVERISIGRDRCCDIQLTDVLVSRDHALIQKIREVYYIHDNGSTNGTFLNGERVPPRKYARLRSGDIITIGKNNLQLS